MAKQRPGSRGQAAVFLLMALTVLAFMILWKNDLHRIIFVKDRTQNAGDAAALAGARWQAAALNLVGELNLLHALAIESQDAVAQDMITNMQARICFAGPMAGVLAMQQAAKLNGIHVDQEFTDYMHDHARKVRREYGMDVGGAGLLDEPYEGAWEEYADMIEMVADEGIAAGIDNHKRYDDFGSGHILVAKDFYRAVASRNWCWFFLHHPGLLESHRGHGSWPPLPPPDPPVPQDCEYLALRLQMIETYLPQVVSTNHFIEHAGALGYDPLPVLTTQVTETVHHWMIYQPGVWREWEAIKDGFPVSGELRPEFDYAGADVVSRVHASAARLTPDLGNAEQEDEVVWSAASKPFGYFAPEDDGERLPPSLWSLVMPAFRAVRLIPADTASEGSPGGFDIAFRRHINEHLPPYLSNGIITPGCGYCRSLKTFDEPEFRKTGSEWLGKNSGLCTLPPPNSGGRGGGSKRAH